jgi:hypothetical protein
VVRGIIRRVAAGEGRTGADVARTITAIYGGGETSGAHDDWTEEIARLRSAQAAADAELAVLRAKLASYDSAISWATSCTGCARTLDAANAERERAEQAEAKLAAIAELCKGRSIIATEQIRAVISGEEDGDGR